MATELRLLNPQTGIQKKAFIGFSWTSLFFGPFVMMFRGDWLVFFVTLVAALILNAVTAGIASIVFALVLGFTYNRWHARRLMERGYTEIVFAEGMTTVQASAALKLA